MKTLVDDDILAFAGGESFIVMAASARTLFRRISLTLLKYSVVLGGITSAPARLSGNDVPGQQDFGLGIEAGGAPGYPTCSTR